MTKREHFEREVTARVVFGLHKDFVVHVIESYVGEDDDDVDDNVFTNGLAKRVAERKHIVVMPLADRDLSLAIVQEQFHKNIPEVIESFSAAHKIMMSTLTTVVHFLH